MGQGGHLRRREAVVFLVRRPDLDRSWEWASSREHELSTAELAGADLIAIEGGDAPCRVVVEAIRALAAVPILVLRSSRGSDGVVALLNAGADYCLAADSAREERNAVVRALLRRWPSRVNPGEPPSVQLDDSARTLWLWGEPFRFGPVAFSVVRYLVKNADRWVTQRQIVETAIETNYRPDSAVARVQIHQIRKTLRHFRWCIRQDGNRGCGYMFSVSNAPPLSHESGTFAIASSGNEKPKTKHVTEASLSTFSDVRD